MGEEGGLMTPETEITSGGEWGGGDVKRRTFSGVSVEIFWNNTFHVKSLLTKILTNFKATQAKSLKIVVAKSLITNAHAMIIIYDIRLRELPYRGYTSR